jgi:hypothetical protein
MTMPHVAGTRPKTSRSVTAPSAAVRAATDAVVVNVTITAQVNPAVSAEPDLDSAQRHGLLALAQMSGSACHDR